MIKNKVVLWGHDNYHTLGVIRQFANSELDVLLIIDGPSAKLASRSKYCPKYLTFKKKREALTYLLATFTDKINKAVLLVMGDDQALYIDTHRELLSQCFYLSGTSEQGLLSKLLDKNLMNKLAEEHNFLIPTSLKFTKNTSLEEVGFPCILKPTYIKQGRKDFKTRVFHAKRELEQFIKLLSKDNEYILQEYIQKEKDILITGYRNKSGKVVLAGTYYKDRWSDDGGGSHGYIVPEIPNYCNPNGIQSFLDYIDYYGLFSIEYGLYKGIAYFYEFNLRNDGTSHLFYQCGANLPLSWAFDCLDYPNTVPIKVSGKHYAINEILDQINIKRKVVSKKKWQEDFNDATAFFYYDPNDLEPWKYVNKTAWFNRTFRAILKKYRPIVVSVLNHINKRK